MASEDESALPPPKQPTLWSPLFNFRIYYLSGLSVLLLTNDTHILSIACMDKRDVCKVCQYGAKLHKLRYSIYQRRLRNSSRGGCPVCSLLLQGIYQCLSLSDLNKTTLDPRENCFLWDAKGFLIHIPSDYSNKEYEFYVTPGKPLLE